MDYQDFVVLLGRAPEGQGISTRVVRSPAGEAEAPFVNPVSAAELDRIWQAALAARQEEGQASRDLSKISRMAEVSLEELGARLFSALITGPIRSCWFSSMASVHSEGKGLRLKLQIDLADPLLAPLVELPWECLFSPENGGFLGLQRETPILRHLRLPLAAGNSPQARPLRVLVVSSHPQSMAPLSLRDESGRIAETLGKLPGIETVSLHNPGIETLRDVLLQREFHVLHFMGHGGFDSGSGQGVLYFTDGDGTPVPLTGSLLATHLADVDSLRLVFLNAGSTARTHSGAPFAGIATALLRAGLPAVIAMQRPIRDVSALEFSHTVYRRLALGAPIDTAVTEARLALVRRSEALLEWGTPVLFIRGEVGPLFSTDPVSASPEIQSAPRPSAATVIAGHDFLFQQARERLVRRYRLEIQLTEEGFESARLSGPRRVIYKSSKPSPLDLPALVEMGDELNLLTLNDKIGDWRSSADRLGRALYQMLDDSPRVSRELSSALSLPPRESDLCLHFRGPASTLAVPFELVKDGAGGYLCFKHLLTRESDVEGIVRKTERFDQFLERLVKDGELLRVLVVGANVDGEIPNAEVEAVTLKERLEKILRSLGIPHEVVLLRGAEATYKAVTEALRRGRFHLFHYAGHGRYDDKMPEIGGLVLADKGRMRTLRASDLNLLVKDSDLQFVFLSCCLGARTAEQIGRGDFHGVLDALVKADVPTVLGYRWTVLDESALALAEHFYEELWRTLSPADALLAARREIATGEAGWDDSTWASPVLLTQNS